MQPAARDHGATDQGCRSGPAAPRTGRRTSAGSSPSSSGPTGPSRASSSSTLPRDRSRSIPQPADHPVRADGRVAGRGTAVRSTGSRIAIPSSCDWRGTTSRTKEEAPLTAHIPWDIEEYDISGNGNSIVLVANEDGQSRLHVIDARTGRRRPTPRLGGRADRRTSAFGRDRKSSRSPGALPQIAPRNLLLRPGNPLENGMDQAAPGQPEAQARVSCPALIRYESFDGRPIPAFVRRPKPPIEGPYPVLIELHGGLASQSRPCFSSLDDYLVDELGHRPRLAQRPGLVGLWSRVRRARRRPETRGRSPRHRRAPRLDRNASATSMRLASPSGVALTAATWPLPP